MRNFDELSEREVLALAIANKEEDSRIYADIADGLRENYPGFRESLFQEMMEEEGEHRRRLLEKMVPAKVRRAHPPDPPSGRKGLHPAQAGLAGTAAGAGSRPVARPEMELVTQRFYRGAAALHRRAIRELLGDLAEAKSGTTVGGRAWWQENVPGTASAPRRRSPAPALRAAGHPAGPGRADGRLGLDARPAVRGRLRHPRHHGRLPRRPGGLLGAGICMGFAEALSDDGSLTGRGRRCCAAWSAA